MTMHQSYSTVEDVKIIEFPSYADKNNCSLEVFEGDMDVPFEIQRMFTVHAEQGNTRGKHAHKESAQLLICSEGTCKVTCDDNTHTKEFILEDPKVGLLIPPHIWAEQKYEQSPTILIVLCDQHYNEEEYIRDYDLFQDYRSQLYH